MFTDDKNLFISDSNIENPIEAMNEELRKLDKIFLFILQEKEKIHQISYLHCI